jgi:hypothetical protein
MGLGLGLGLQFYRRIGAGIDAQAQAHFNRVIADGGLVPSGLSGVNAFFNTIKTIYGTSDINTAISVGLDPQVLGYKLGAGSGTTLGQAAQKLYSVKSTENLLTFSEQFDNADWAKTNLTVSANATTSPSGILNADKLIATAIDSNHILSQIPASFTSLTAYTFSYYAKSAEYTKCGIRIGGTGYATTPLAAINLTNGSIISQQGFTSLTVTLTNNNWYRISGTFTSATGLTTNIQPLSDSYTIIANNFSFLGNGTSGIFAWGAQLNTGSVALPYTPTTTTAETLADVVQTTAASQPLLLVHSGENYWFGSGVSGNFVSTPNAAANQITGNIELTAYNINLRNINGLRYLISKTDVYSLSINASGILFLEYRVGVTTFVASSTASISLSFAGSVKVFRDSTSGQITFYTSIDNINFTQLGAIVSGTIGLINNIANNVFIGQYNNLTNTWFDRIGRATIATSLGGAPVVDFNPNQYNAATSQTQWTSSTGEVWSIQTGTATTGYKGVLVDRSIVQSDGMGDRLTSGTLPSRTTYTRYLAITPLNTASQYVFSGSGTTNHLSYKQITNTFRLFNSATEVINTGIQPFLSQLFTADLSSPIAFMRVNNGADASNLFTTSASTSVNFGTDGSGGNPANAILQTAIETNSVDTNPRKTSMYNYIRSINGNSF